MSEFVSDSDYEDHILRLNGFPYGFGSYFKAYRNRDYEDFELVEPERSMFVKHIDVDELATSGYRITENPTSTLPDGLGFGSLDFSLLSPRMKKAHEKEKARETALVIENSLFKDVALELIPYKGEVDSVVLPNIDAEKRKQIKPFLRIINHAKEEITGLVLVIDNDVKVDGYEPTSIIDNSELSKAA